MTKCFGIISWFPNKQPDRELRQERLNRLLKRINELWPEIDILIITQNWDDFKPISISNKVVRDDHEIGLGILGARKRLGEVFLQHTEYDYLITMDDDCLIDTTPASAKHFIDQLDTKPDGFLVLEELAQLNLCCVSRYIYSIEPMVDINPQKSEGYEDLIYTQLLKHKYPDYEIHNKAMIQCLQFNKAQNEKAPSTWSGCSGASGRLLISRSNFFLAAFAQGDFDMKALKEASRKAFPDPNADTVMHNIFGDVKPLANEGNIAYAKYKEAHKPKYTSIGNPFLSEYLRK